MVTLLAEREGEGPDADVSGAEVPEGGPDLAAARKLLSRRQAALTRELDPRRRRQRAYALLARGGFDPDVIRQALTAGLDPDAEPEPEGGP